MPQMPIWDHLEELRERVLVAGLVAATAILGCFCFSKASPLLGVGASALMNWRFQWCLAF